MKLIERCFTLLSTVFQSCQGDSSHYSCLSWVLHVPVLGWALKCLVQGRSHERKRNRKSSAARIPDYESKTQSLSHAAPPVMICTSDGIANMVEKGENASYYSYQH